MSGAISRLLSRTGIKPRIDVTDAEPAQEPVNVEPAKDPSTIAWINRPWMTVQERQLYAETEPVPDDVKKAVQAATFKYGSEAVLHFFGLSCADVRKSCIDPLYHGHLDGNDLVCTVCGGRLNDVREHDPDFFNRAS